MRWSDLVAAVEEISGRTVRAFMSMNNPDPDLAVEFFLLEPIQPSADAGELTHGRRATRDTPRDDRPHRGGHDQPLRRTPGVTDGAAAVRWDPAQYARYGSERSRPFFDLVGRIGAATPRTVVDLGCGSGELTVSLAERWPEAEVRGIDSSPQMLERAPRGQRVAFSVGRAEEVDLTGTDVLVANAVLQWVPEHPRLLPTWAGQLRDGGWLAFQVPANFEAPSHRLMRDLADSPAWRERLRGVLRGPETVLEPDRYLELLVDCGMRAEVWQTEYLHVLEGPDPVLEWVRGTGLRPVLAALDEADAAAFSSEYAALLRRAYPARALGTVFGFRRTFVVARRA